MDILTGVLEQRSDELVDHIVERHGFSPGVARAFVDLASTELIKSWRWQTSALQAEDLSTWSNVHRLLGTVHANAIAAALEVSPDEVWRALRAFVPKVLLLASRSAPSETRHRDSHGPYVRPPSLHALKGLEAAS